MSDAKYHCSQPDFYSAGRMVIRAAIRKQPELALVKPKYDLPYFNSLLTELAAAEALPDEDFRAAVVKAIKLECETAATKCLNTWQLLKGYIEDAEDFKGAMQKIALEAAGSKKYQAASGFDWESVTGLMASGIQFFTDNTAQLTANGNMPPVFIATFTNVAAAFQLALSYFQDQEELREQETQAKITANNTLYDKIIQLCKDGKRAFRNDEALREQFVWEKVLYIIRGAGIAGLRGSVTNQADATAIAGATITVVETGDTGLTDREGIYRITGVPYGSYTVQCTASGFITAAVPFSIPKGTISQLDFSLTV